MCWLTGAQAVVTHLRTITNKLSVALTIRLAMIVRTSVMLIVSNSLLPMESVSSNILLCAVEAGVSSGASRWFDG